MLVERECLGGEDRGLSIHVCHSFSVRASELQ